MQIRVMRDIHLTERTISLFLSWDLGEIHSSSALEFRIVETVFCSSTEIPADRG